MEKVHINNGENRPICGTENFSKLANIKNCTSCLDCQRLRTEVLRKLRLIRRLEADRKIVHDYLYGANKNLSIKDFESYKIRLEEIEEETKKNHPQSSVEAYMMSELSMPIEEFTNV